MTINRRLFTLQLAILAATLLRKLYLAAIRKFWNRRMISAFWSAIRTFRNRHMILPSDMCISGPIHKLFDSLYRSRLFLQHRIPIYRPCFHLIDGDLVQRLPVVTIFLLMACQVYAMKTMRHNVSEEHGTAYIDVCCFVKWSNSLFILFLHQVNVWALG